MSTVLVALMVLALPAVLLPLSSVRAGEPVDTAFDRVWERTDLPVADGMAARTWIWGPASLDDSLTEESGSEDGGSRRVRYFDKGRMEISDSETNAGSPGNVQSGQIVTELFEARILSGDGQTIDLPPTEANVAGDVDAPGGATYGSLGLLRSLPPFDEGASLNTQFSADGVLREVPELGSYDVVAGMLVEDTGHRVASVFWDILNSSGVVWNGTAFVEEKLFAEPLVATGAPLTEAYWLRVHVAGVEQDVLIQCFEKRCLTYTPANPAGWRVESNNAGLHYYDWRYTQPADEEKDDPTEAPEVELPVAQFNAADGTTPSIHLEVAATSATRSCGLMHRQELPADVGMLFVWEQDLQGSFWNCNTFVPLTLAWIDADGVIVGFSEMEAQVPGEDQEVISYPPPGPYRYVIEANQGWFADHGIKPGDTVDLTDALAHGDTSSDTLCQQLGMDCN